MSDGLARLRVIVTGRVQGVFYRAGAMAQAKRLGIKGFVRNLSDGSVELLGEGSRAALESFLEWAKHGPSRARVAHASAEWSEFTGEFADFRSIRRGNRPTMSPLWRNRDAPLAKSIIISCTLSRHLGLLIL